MRKLASIQKIVSLSPIEGADKIEQAHVLGWSLVVKKGEFSPASLAVFFEIDSILPDKSLFEFMRASKFRVKTRTMRGCLSQGLALPISVFSELENLPLEEGQDVTEILGVKKYEIPEHSSVAGMAVGNFPGYVPKTDEIRIQSIPEILQEVKDIPFYATVKMDGTSATYIHHEGETWVCSRNLALKESENNAHWKMEKKYGILEKLKKLGSFALQGEVCGPGIQANRIGLTAPELFVFNVYDIKAGRILGFSDMMMMLKQMEIPSVPVEWENRVLNGETVTSFLQMAEGKYANGHPREGVVFRPMVPVFSPTLKGRLSFKAISNSFLLKTGE